MSSVKTRTIPPPPTFPPPALPPTDGELTTYTRTRSVSPTPFIVTHDTFIRDNRGDNKKTDKTAAVSNGKDSGALRKLEVGRFSQPPVISVEPATPPVLEQRRECQESRADRELQTEDDGCKPREKYACRKGKLRQKKSGPSDQVECPENDDGIKRRDSKKLRSHKTDDGAKIPEESQIGGPSKYPENCVTSQPQPAGDARASGDKLTEKEKTVITEVLSSRQARSRTGSRSEGAVSPDLTAGDSSDAREVSSLLGREGENKTMKMSTETESLISPQQNIKEAANIENEIPPGKSKNMEHLTQVLSETLETQEITANSMGEKTMEHEIETNFDPFAIVENIADLTVEHLKETLLGSSEAGRQDDTTGDLPSTTTSASDQAEEKETKEILEKLSKLSSDMKTLEEEDLEAPNAKVSPRKKKSRLRVVDKEEGAEAEAVNNTQQPAGSRPGRKDRKDDKDSEDKNSTAAQEFDFIQMMNPNRHKKVEQKEEKNSLLSVETENILNDSSSSTDNILNSGATPPSRAKKVKKEIKKENNEEIKLSHSQDKTKVSHDFIEMMNRNRVKKLELKEEVNILSEKTLDSSSQAENYVNGQTMTPSRSRRKNLPVEDERKESGVTNVSLSESGTVGHNYDAKKVSAVNIPTIRTFESVQIPTQNETNNGQMCRQRQDTGRRGKMLASCVIVFLVALLSFLIFSLLDITRTEPKVSVAENGQDYGYFKIKQWP